MSAVIARELHPLLERDEELREIEAALVAAREGRGTLTFVEGAAGTGKSRLLHEAAALAREAGMDVLGARGDEHERDFAFGVALQLLEARAARLDPAGRAGVMAGAAGLAEPLLSGAAGRGDRDLFALVHGLYWVTHNLADRRPILLVVDDAQWADEPSLHFVSYLSRRIADLPVAVMAARRTGADEEPAPLRALAAEPGAHRLRMRPLSAPAAEELVRARLGEASDTFCAACAGVTAGNPFFLEELLRTVVSEAVAPTDAGAGEVRELAPDAVSRSILLRLSRLPPEAVALARAVAVLGRTTVAHAAHVGGLDPPCAVEVARALVRAGVLADAELLEFPHPIVRSVVAADTTRAELGELELRAAEQLHRAGEPPERVAAHLLAAPVSGAAWAVEPLRVAAAHALAGGGPESAVRLLRRALAEPPAPDQRADVLRELGGAEAAAALPEAAERFEAALRLRDDPLERSRIRVQLARGLAAGGRYVEAAEAYELGAEEARLAGRPDVAAELEAGYLTVARLDPSLYPVAAQRIERLVSQPPDDDGPGQRMLLADVALARGYGGAPTSEVLPIAERAWADGALLAEQGPDSQSIYVLTGALAAVDALDRVLAVLDAALHDAQRRGAVMAVATVHCCLLHPLLLQGRIADTLAAGEQVGRFERDGWELLLPTGRAWRAIALLEHGAVAAADDVLRLDDDERWREALPYAPLLEARAQVRLAQRRPAEALEDALASGALVEHRFCGTRARGILQWRLLAATAAAALGDKRRADELCDEDLDVARAGDRPREIGAALRVSALLADGERRIERCREAVDVLERSESTLELMRALVDLGGALRRAGHRHAAREPLARALDLATPRGATVLARRAREELLAAGARPRRAALRGVESLTPSELRVARLAGDGLTNREIAEALFVSRKTVDFHLGHVYQKLGVQRDGLPVALAPGS